MAEDNGSPQPGGTAGGPDNGAPSAGAAPTDWTSGISDDYKGMIAAKGWQDMNSVLQSYSNLEKLAKGDPNTLLRLPGEKADQKEWDAIYNKLGRPEKAEGYKLPFRDGADKAFKDWAGKTFHGLGLSQKQAEAIIKSYDELNDSVKKASLESLTTKAAEGRAAIEKEWGAATKQNMEIARRAVREFGISSDIVDTLEEKVGYTEVMKFMHNIGTRLGEDNYAGGDNGGSFGAMTPAQAKYEISQLKNDKAFTERYMKGDIEALSKMDRLQRYAAGVK